MKRILYNMLFFRKILQGATIILFMIELQSCKKFIEVPSPDNSITGENVFEDNETATAAITSVYSQISSSSFTDYLAPTLSIYCGIFSDELMLFPGATSNASLQQAYTNSLTSNSNLVFWDRLYYTIYKVNFSIEGLLKSNSIDEPIKKQLLGEAKFIRAFCYFYLTNLYGDVPLTLSVDYKENASLSQSSMEDVYKQIISDLEEAESDLSDNYLDGNLMPTNTMRTRPSKWVATALLARAYLYTKDYAKAISSSTKLIDNKTLFDTVSINTVFDKDNKEAIWQLQPVIPDLNTTDGFYLTIPESGPNETNAFVLNDQLISAFDSIDKRYINWTKKINVNGSDYFYSSKYKVSTFGEPISEYEVVLRLAEQYLIRAEAHVVLGDLSEGLIDLNVIRARAGLSMFNSENGEEIVSKIYHERFLEFFTEWGHRWFDLKRTSKIDKVMSTVTMNKGGTWESYKQLLPIQNSELIAAPNLKQNSGY